MSYSELLLMYTSVLMLGVSRVLAILQTRVESPFVSPRDMTMWRSTVMATAYGLCLKTSSGFDGIPREESCGRCNTGLLSLVRDARTAWGEMNARAHRKSVCVADRAGSSLP